MGNAPAFLNFIILSPTPQSINIPAIIPPIIMAGMLPARSRFMSRHAA